MIATAEIALKTKSPSVNLNTAKESTSRAIWIDQSVSVERRSRMRSQAAFEVLIQGLNDQFEPIGEPQEGMILNYSEKGVCVEHSRLLPEQYVSVTWHDHQSKKHEAILRLKWCRSTQNRTILSGGRVYKMIKDNS